MAETWRSNFDGAPKDGTPILSWDGDTYGVVVWCGCRRHWRLVECAGNRPAQDGDAWTGITHWMPLPPPPGEGRVTDLLPDCMMPDGGEPCVGYTQEFGARMEADRRLRRIAAIIEHVDNRCMAADGPVTPTLQEMTQAEISMIYALASGKRMP